MHGSALADAHAHPPHRASRISVPIPSLSTRLWRTLTMRHVALQPTPTLSIPSPTARVRGAARVLAVMCGTRRGTSCPLCLAERSFISLNDRTHAAFVPGHYYSGGETRP